MCREYVDEVVTVSEGEIASAILTVLEKQKLVAEGAGAVGIAAAMYHKVNTEGKTVCALLSGGNVDVTMLERILTRGLAKEGRTVSFSTVLPDQPHALASFLEVVSSLGANVLDVNHERRNTKAAIGSCVVNLSLGPETRPIFRRSSALCGERAIGRGAVNTDAAPPLAGRVCLH